MSDTRNEPPARLVSAADSRVWPMLLRAGGLSVHPGRVLIGVVTCLVMLAIGLLFDRVRLAGDEDADRLFGMALSSWRGLMHGDASSVLPPGSEMPLRFATEIDYGVWPFVLIALLGPIFAFGSGAMARMIGVDVAADADMSTRHAVRFALVRWKPLLIAHLVPIGLLIVVAVGLSLFGKVLLSVEGLSVVGALLFGVAALAGIVAMGVWLALLIGGWMLAPAVVCESTDGVDAIQRCFAYVLKRVGHAILYLVILLGVGLVGLWIARFIVIGGFGFAVDHAAAWLGWEREVEVFSAMENRSLSTRIIAGWRGLIELLVSGWMVSYISTGATLMYLALRRVCDDQDPRDLWMEAGRRAPVMPELAEDRPGDGSLEDQDEA